MYESGFTDIVAVNRPPLEQPKFTALEVGEIRRVNRKLDKLPRFRMKTPVGRVVLNLSLRLVELYPLVVREKTTARRTLRSVRAAGVKVKLRIFVPQSPAVGVVMDYHGGGWTIGNARMDDAQNAALAERLSVVVVSVDYGLALTRAITQLADQCAAAAQWTIQNAMTEFGVDKIVIKGSSAGSHLVAAALLRLRDRGALTESVVGSVLYFGLYDFSGTRMVRDAGHEILLLDAPTVRATLCKLTPHMTDEQRKAPAVSPLYADLSGLPAALFVVGAKDMLLEDSRAMEARWRETNHNSELLIVPECPHAFDRLGTAAAAKVGDSTDAWVLERLAYDAGGDATGHAGWPVKYFTQTRCGIEQ